MQRRQFLVRVGGGAVAATVLHACGGRVRMLGAYAPAATTDRPGLGPLRPAGDLLDLPDGFRYVVVQRAGDPVDGGLTVPGQPDGMACFAGPDGGWVLLRNHELGAPEWMREARASYGMTSPAFAGTDAAPTAGPVFDPACAGGVCRVEVDPVALRAALDGAAPAGLVRRTTAALLGTELNCAGGTFDQGWVSCEETDGRASADGRLHDHGWAFLVRLDRAPDDPPERVVSWGRFKREGVVMDPATRVVYMTEDDKEGRFYRFVPSTDDPFGPGSLQALVVAGHADTSSWKAGDKGAVSWVVVADPGATSDTCREQAAKAGAARVFRGEGVTWLDGSVWFTATQGGPAEAGQLFRYTPGKEELEAVVVVEDRAVLSMPDNLIATPGGGLLVAEDNYDAKDGCRGQFLRLVTPDGQITDLAFNRHAEHDGEEVRPGAEFAGPCFSPDKTVLFVNLQGPEDVTVAITGPWPWLA